jgi:ABC-type transport system substrate-binding protein
LSRAKVLAIGVIIIVILAAVGIYLTTRPISLAVSIAASTSVGTAGSPVSFTVIPTPSSVSVSSVVWNFGDGVNQTVSGASTTHIYANGGRYLVFAQVTATYQSLLITSTVVGSNGLALFTLTVEPNLPPDQAPDASVPTISFAAAVNPTAPVFNVGDIVHPVGGFLELPANSNWTIQQYAWDFGNGQRQSVRASTSGGPAGNVTGSYSSPGLYPLSLTLTTASNGATFSVTTVRTVAAQSSALPFALLTTSSGAPNPGIITAVEVQPAGPYSWDPQLDYDIVGFEELLNVFQTLVWYNGTSTTSFIPYLASELPTRDNGGISPDYMSYTFQIRNDQYFSNGDPVTAYDVWFSMARCIAFTGGSPGTPDWIQAQFLVPGVQNGTATVYANNTWAVATNAVTYDNASNTVTFHFNRPMPSTLVFQVLGNPEGAGIVDARYVSSIGAGFGAANWDDYKNQANSGSYNTQMQWSPIGSGPYMVQSYTPGESVELVPNPHFGGVPGIPKQTTSVVINWVKTADTAVLMLQDGQADAASNLPPTDFPAVQKLQSQGLVNIYNYPTFQVYTYNFNIEVDKALEETQFGTGFNEPSNYFADLPTRLAWINAYDYAGYLNNILGNAKYGTTFGTGFQGVIPAGMIYFVPPNEVGGLPTQNMNAARGNYSISAWVNQKITIPIVVLTGDAVNLAAAEEWSGILAQISNGNINAKVVQVTTPQEGALLAQGANPMAVSYNTWAPDYPDASDYVNPFYSEGGYYASGANLLASNFAALPPSSPNDVVHVNGTAYTQAQVWGWMQGNITLGGTSVDPAVRQRAYKVATELAIAMGLDVYVYQATAFWYFRSWLKGYERQENPITVDTLLYYWVTKE